jgi:adenine-specific DNA-methyltransferase
MNDEGMLPLTWWDKKEYSSTAYGTNILVKITGSTESFSYPKSFYSLFDTLKVMGLKSTMTCLDYFAGSGTTGHATIALNREDGGKRKYILVEQGEYFDTVLKPRMQKVVYAADWKDGKAANHSTGISHAFKVLKLESYEDTLNNLELTRPNTDLFEHMTLEQQNDYLMHYMLKLESKDSLLSVKQFQKPFNYQLNITTDSAGAYQKHPVDLVETFNYLLGLRVKHIDMQQRTGYVQVVGHLPTGEHTCILWRDCETLPYAKLDSLLAKLHINPNDREYDLIYINGDHNIPSVYIGSDGSERQLKVRSIEHEFFARMFAESM